MVDILDSQIWIPIIKAEKHAHLLSLAESQENRKDNPGNWGHTSQQVQIHAPWKFEGFGVNPLWPLKQIFTPSKIRFSLAPCEMLPSRHAATHAESILAQKMNSHPANMFLPTPFPAQEPCPLHVEHCLWNLQLFPQFEIPKRLCFPNSSLLCMYLPYSAKLWWSWEFRTLLSINPATNSYGGCAEGTQAYWLVYCHSCFWQLETICLASWIRQWVNHKHFLSHLV